MVTPGNEMKWQVVEPTQGTFDWSGADNLVAFAKANHQLVRGHTLCWHNQLPDWLTTGVSSGTISKSQLSSLLQQHIYTEVGRYRGRIWQWDVCNEFLTDSNPSGLNPNDFWIANLGPGVIANAFRWARQADPNVLLFYNDYNIGGEDGSNAKADAAYALVQQLLDQHVPIDGVGNQGHLDTQYGWSPQRLQEDIERYASLGLKVAITEADVRTFVDNATDQVPTDNLAQFAQPFEFSEMLKAVPGGARGHLVHRLGLHRRGLLGARLLHRRGIRHHLRRQPQPQARLLRTAVRSLYAGRPMAPRGAVTPPDPARPYPGPGPTGPAPAEGGHAAAGGLRLPPASGRRRGARGRAGPGARSPCRGRRARRRPRWRSRTSRQVSPAARVGSASSGMRAAARAAWTSGSARNACAFSRRIR